MTCYSNPPHICVKVPAL